MRALLLVVDPDPASYTHELARRARSGLAAAGNEVTVVDLHAIGFAAAMSPVEREAYHGDEPLVSEQVAAQAALVTTADALVVVYPSIASGLPAILKGWFERVLVPGVGFGFNAQGKVRPALTDIRHIVGIATYREPRWKVAVRNDNGRRTLTRAFRMSCGLQARSRWFGCHEPTSSAGRDEFADRVEREMTGLS
jgi:NAD(P)H dehydrogenase (quinone)